MAIGISSQSVYCEQSLLTIRLPLMVSNRRKEGPYRFDSETGLLLVKPTTPVFIDLGQSTQTQFELVMPELLDPLRGLRSGL